MPRELNLPSGTYRIYPLKELEEVGLARSVEAMPFSMKVLLESLYRHLGNGIVSEEEVKAVGLWGIGPVSVEEIPFYPSRVLLQDFTGVPLIVDLAAMRGVAKRLNKDPKLINPQVPVHLVVDHSIQVDYFRRADAFALNLELEYERNKERYQLLKWSQTAFANLQVVPPGTGIVHQVNLEYLASVVDDRVYDGARVAFPDTLLGTDSHTPMVNGLGVLGWGVGGIEAEAVMLGQPYYMSVPEVVGVELTGELREGVTATDLVLYVTELLRRRDVVGKFVEFFGPGLEHITVPDRATVSNMAPEYGATVGFFPIDYHTLAYLRLTGRSESRIRLVEAYAKAQGLFLEDYEWRGKYTEVIELDLSKIEPSLAGPANPEDRIDVKQLKRVVLEYIRRARGQSVQGGSANTVTRWEGEGGATIGSPISVEVRFNGETCRIGDGSLVIAAITSCTNTSNPTVMIGAGLLAKRAVERGLSVPAHVKTSLAPGSQVVLEYLRQTGLYSYLERLGFSLVGYGCTTCIGNSGPLPRPVSEAIEKHNLTTFSVLSGNRNFEGRIHPQVKGNFLASPILVVAYAIAGRVDIDLTEEPLAHDRNGKPVYLRELWPEMKEVAEVIERSIKPELFQRKYADVFRGDERWRALEAPAGEVFHWDPSSTYIKEPPFFEGFSLKVEEPDDIRGARVLVLLGDRITTDHISPAGAILPNSPAGEYLRSLGVTPEDFNTYGARRGNHEVMMRGTFANVRLKNQLVPGREGWWTKHLPSGELTSVYEGAMRYKAEGVPLIVLAGKQYGAGSSRDWAAKGVQLLGVKAVIAESFERIHRSNLVGMGVLPLQFEQGQSWKGLGLDGTEVFDILGISDGLHPKKKLHVRARKPDGSVIEFRAIARLDTPIEVEYYKNGGILNYVLRKLLSS
ncbi:MAG: aconitate hydratase AcnA [Thaumarchaeota archaeon]|nr:aconitate hydratase AcnA [Candidatus Calditenuaceae archaeon]MDW8187556.1 aconitate hydratase AcnA [Nitrososphaerota archaeon]